MFHVQVLFKMNNNFLEIQYGLNPQTQDAIKSILLNQGIYIKEIHLTQYCTNQNDPDHISFVFNPDESRLRYNTEYCHASPCKDPASRARVGFETPQQGTHARTYWDNVNKLVFHNIINLIMTDGFYLSKFNITAVGKNKRHKKSKRKLKKGKSKKKSKKRKSKKKI